jgi:hypothetical protein
MEMKVSKKNIDTFLIIIIILVCSIGLQWDDHFGPNPILCPSNGMANCLVSFGSIRLPIAISVSAVFLKTKKLAILLWKID